MAATPGTIGYQTRLYDREGQPLAGTVDVTFTLYAAKTGGSALWSETHPGLTPQGGEVAVELGSITPLDLEFDQPYWLSITVGRYGILSPRKALSGAPYARRAAKADTTASASWDGLTNKPELSGPYANLLVVAKSGGQYASIQAAVDSISDASESNPYLVKVGPGTYTEAVVLKDYVSLQGSGQGLTVIVGPPGTRVALDLGDHSRISDLTIKNQQAEERVLGIRAHGAYTVDIYRVGVEVERTDSQAYEPVFAVRIFPGSSARLSELTIAAAGHANTGYVYGVYTENVTLHADRLDITSTGGTNPVALRFQANNTDEVWEGSISGCSLSGSGGSNVSRGLQVGASDMDANGLSRMRVRASSLAGGTAAIYTGNAKCHALLAASQVDGGLGGSGTTACVRCFDGNYTGLSSDCSAP